MMRNQPAPVPLHPEFTAAARKWAQPEQPTRPTMRRILALSLPFAAVLAAGAPAAAQDSGDRVNALIVYGDDPCPPSTGNEITVCARKNESERFRIPEPLRGNPTSPRNQAWTNRVQAYEMVGATGTNSCSPVGPGGSTGCLSQLIRAAYAERRNGGDARFGQLIAAERAKRLSTIDEEAAATQARVEQLERDYDARQAQGSAAAGNGAPAAVGSAGTTTRLATPPAGGP
jgi:hypothetical protein